MTRSSYLIAGLLLVASACGPKVAVDDAGGDDSTDPGTTSDPTRPSTTSTTSTSGPSAGTVSTSGDPTVSTSASTTDGPRPGYCANACTVAADCCQGQPDCPGPFPNNWSCDEGACVYGGCVTDEQCADVFADEAFICVKTETHIGCYPGCETDDDCETQFFSGWVCASVSVDGRPYCVPPPGCDPDPCSGYGVCDPETGLCQCFDDADCSADPNLVCHLF